VPLSFDGERATVVWHRPDARDISWRVSDTKLTALRQLPAFVVEELSIPDTAEDGETIEVGITVRNDGDRKDWFVAALGHSNISGDTHLEIPYDAGEKRTVPRDLTVRFSDADALTVRLDWGIDAIEKQITKA